MMVHSLCKRNCFWWRQRFGRRLCLTFLLTTFKHYLLSFRMPLACTFPWCTVCMLHVPIFLLHISMNDMCYTTSLYNLYYKWKTFPRPIWGYCQMDGAGRNCSTQGGMAVGGLPEPKLQAPVLRHRSRLADPRGMHRPQAIWTRSKLWWEYMGN